MPRNFLGRLLVAVCSVSVVVLTMRPAQSQQANGFYQDNVVLTTSQNADGPFLVDYEGFTVYVVHGNCDSSPCSDQYPKVIVGPGYKLSVAGGASTSDFTLGPNMVDTPNGKGYPVFYQGANLVHANSDKKPGDMTAKDATIPGGNLAVVSQPLNLTTIAQAPAGPSGMVGPTVPTGTSTSSGANSGTTTSTGNSPAPGPTSPSPSGGGCASDPACSGGGTMPPPPPSCQPTCYVDPTSGQTTCLPCQ